MRVILIAAAALALSACSTQSQFTPRPVGIGGGPNNLRRAPCACNEVKQKPGSALFHAAKGVQVSA